jgi:hypothetical protein
VAVLQGNALAQRADIVTQMQRAGWTVTSENGALGIHKNSLRVSAERGSGNAIAAFRRLSECGKNYSVPPLRRQPPTVYGEYGVVYVHPITVSCLARKTKGHPMLQSLNHLTLAVSDLQKASLSGAISWGLRFMRSGIPVHISVVAISGFAFHMMTRDAWFPAGERLHPLRI